MILDLSRVAAFFVREDIYRKIRLIRLEQEILFSCVYGCFFIIVYMIKISSEYFLYSKNPNKEVQEISKKKS